jgi:hypothetical protein
VLPASSIRLRPASVTPIEPSRSLRRTYLEWIEDQVESFKESIPRADLLRLAEEAIEELRESGDGQYQLTELLLCTAVDRRIVSLLRLPTYRTWCADRAVLASVRVPPEESACVRGDAPEETGEAVAWEPPAPLRLVERDVA